MEIQDLVDAAPWTQDAPSTSQDTTLDPSTSDVHTLFPQLMDLAPPPPSSVPLPSFEATFARQATTTTPATATEGTQTHVRPCRSVLPRPQPPTTVSPPQRKVRKLLVLQHHDLLFTSLWTTTLTEWSLVETKTLRKSLRTSVDHDSEQEIPDLMSDSESEDDQDILKLMAENDIRVIVQKQVAQATQLPEDTAPAYLDDPFPWWEAENETWLTERNPCRIHPVLLDPKTSGGLHHSDKGAAEETQFP